MPPQEIAARADELPPPSPELVLLRVFLEAHLATIPPKQAKRFMKRAEELLDLFETGSDVLPLRRGRDGNLVREARKLAANWFRRIAGVVVDRV